MTSFTVGQTVTFKQGSLPASLDRRGVVVKVGTKYVHVKGNTSGIPWRVAKATAVLTLGVPRSRLHR